MPANQKSPAPAHPRQAEGGTILLLVVIVISLVFIIVADAGLVARVELEATRNADWDLITDMALRGGYQVAEAHLREDALAGDGDTLQDGWALPEGIEFEFNPEEYGTGPFIEERNDEDRQQDPEGQIVHVKIFIQDEDRKWPLNILTKGAEAQQRRRIEGLISVIDFFREDTAFDVDAGNADRIANLIHEFMKRPEDSQEGTYGPTPRPLTKTGSILRVTDLALIPGVPPELIYDQVDEQNERIAPGLMNFITPWTDLQVNINTASKAVLQGLFRRSDASVGNDMFDARQRGYDEAAQNMEQDPESSSDSNRTSNSNRSSSSNRQGEGQEEEEEAPTGGWQTVEEAQEQVRTLTTQVFNEARTLMTVSSKTFTIWVEARRGITGPKRIRRWVVRRDGPAIRLILSEEVKYSHYRELTEQEQQEERDRFSGR